MIFPDGFALELVPHCASVPPDGWEGDHLVRPLTGAGHQQATALAAALGTDIEAIYSSPALRCLQTVQPLAVAAGLSIGELPELISFKSGSCAIKQNGPEFSARPQRSSAISPHPGARSASRPFMAQAVGMPDHRQPGDAPGHGATA